MLISQNIFEKYLNCYYRTFIELYYNIIILQRNQFGIWQYIF